MENVKNELALWREDENEKRKKFKFSADHEAPSIFYQIHHADLLPTMKLEVQIILH